MGGSVNGAVSGGAASGSAATTSLAGGAAAAALVLATEDQGCPAGWQANPSTKGGKWVKPERAMEMMQDAKRRGRADYWKDLEPVLVEKENGGGECLHVKVHKGGGGGGKLLSIQNPARTALDHFKEKACRRVRQMDRRSWRSRWKVL